MARIHLCDVAHAGLKCLVGLYLRQFVERLLKCRDASATCRAYRDHVAVQRIAGYLYSAAWALFVEQRSWDREWRQFVGDVAKYCGRSRAELEALLATQLVAFVGDCVIADERYGATRSGDVIASIERGLEGYHTMRYKRRRLCDDDEVLVYHAGQTVRQQLADAKELLRGDHNLNRFFCAYYLYIKQPTSPRAMWAEFAYP